MHRGWAIVAALGLASFVAFRSLLAPTPTPPPMCPVVEQRRDYNDQTTTFLLRNPFDAPMEVLLEDEACAESLFIRLAPFGQYTQLKYACHRSGPSYVKFFVVHNLGRFLCPETYRIEEYHDWRMPQGTFEEIKSGHAPRVEVDISLNGVLKQIFSTIIIAGGIHEDGELAKSVVPIDDHSAPSDEDVDERELVGADWEFPVYDASYQLAPCSSNTADRTGPCDWTREAFSSDATRRESGNNEPVVPGPPRFYYYNPSYVWSVPKDVILDHSKQAHANPLLGQNCSIDEAPDRRVDELTRWLEVAEREDQYQFIIEAFDATRKYQSDSQQKLDALAKVVADHPMRIEPPPDIRHDKDETENEEDDDDICCPVNDADHYKNVSVSLLERERAIEKETEKVFSALMMALACQTAEISRLTLANFGVALPFVVCEQKELKTTSTSEPDNTNLYTSPRVSP